MTTIEKREKKLQQSSDHLQVTSDSLEVTLGEVNRKLSDHIKNQCESDSRRDEFEKYLTNKIDDPNFILKVFKWIGWALTVAASTTIIWYINHFLSRK
jgi:hypothetical protein